MSAPLLWRGRFEIFAEEGARTARRSYVDALGGWVGRRASLEISRAAGLSEAAVRAWWGDGRTTANAAAWGQALGLDAATAVAHPAFLLFTGDLSAARRAGDFGAAEAYIGQLYDTPDLETEADVT